MLEFRSSLMLLQQPFWHQRQGRPFRLIDFRIVYSNDFRCGLNASRLFGFLQDDAIGKKPDRLPL